MGFWGGSLAIDAVAMGLLFKQPYSSNLRAKKSSYRIYIYIYIYMYTHVYLVC